MSSGDNRFCRFCLDARKISGNLRYLHRAFLTQENGKNKTRFCIQLRRKKRTICSLLDNKHGVSALLQGYSF
jgi:hypothetical protein